MCFRKPQIRSAAPVCVVYAEWSDMNAVVRIARFRLKTRSDWEMRTALRQRMGGIGS